MERTLAKDSVIVLGGAILVGLAVHSNFWLPVINTGTNGILSLVNLLAGGSGAVKVA